MQLRQRFTGKRSANRDGDSPQPFAVRCRCGRVAEGTRQPKPQVIRCPGCQESLFVMSRSAFPAPLGGVDVAPIRRRTQFKTEAPSDGVPAPSRSKFVRPRAAAWAVVLLVVATGYWAWRSQQRAKYSAELESAMADGRQLLSKGDFVAAYQRLEIADRAARGLGLTTKTQRSAAHLFAETQVWTNLAPRSVEEFFYVHASKPTPWDAAGVQQAFAHDYAGRTLIVDGWITRDERWVTPPPEPVKKKKRGKSNPPPQPRQEFVPVLDWGLLGESYRSELTLENVRSFDYLPPREPARALFGVELRSLERAADDPQKWIIHIVPSSVVLLTVEGPLVRRGWPESADLTALLSHQAAEVEQAR